MLLTFYDHRWIKVHAKKNIERKSYIFFNEIPHLIWLVYNIYKYWNDKDMECSVFILQSDMDSDYIILK